ncbi:hypothetical protein FM110_05285 [Brachybacterium nesterenkovii]|uniref:Uncharacterized protein n=1 Tax=Brachybacterium nesterenkovii TaxID=47847 RepID=A0A1X6WY18_9MICO|nr:hypothetical protein FM110_05285 [Brachybacterium nesterenkovii]
MLPSVRAHDGQCCTFVQPPCVNAHIGSRWGRRRRGPSSRVRSRPCGTTPCGPGRRRPHL